jgi:quinohemoprotein amine dehydrogenase
VYTGFQWRGRSFERSGDDVGMREVMLVERDWREMSGRWFTGNYDEIGLDVTLRRVGGDPIVAGVHPQGIRASGSAQEVRIFGANLPANLSAADVDFGPGVEVTGVSNVSPDGATARVIVSDDATVGMRDLFVAGANLEGAVAVYPKVDRIRVTPQAGMARVGGANFPKQFQQFEAVAYSDGADGDADTDDDLNLGVVDVIWNLEEYSATYDDDDIDFVGRIDSRGMFTPAEDGPNPNRSGNRNNIGDVWVVATYAPGDGAETIVARGHLLVTVPLYIRFEPWRALQ